MSKAKLEKRLFAEIEQRLDDSIDDSIVRERVIYLLKWYTKKAVFYKRITYTSTILSIIIPVFIAFLNSNAIDVIPFLSEITAHFLIAVLSSLSSVGAGIYAFLHSRENWIRYRTTAESIKRETVLYISVINTTHSNCLAPEFLKRIEGIAEAEINDWYRLRSAEIDKGENSIPSN